MGFGGSRGKEIVLGFAKSGCVRDRLANKSYEVFALAGLWL